MKQTILSKTASAQRDINSYHQTTTRQNSQERLKKTPADNSNTNSHQHLETYAQGLSAFEGAMRYPKLKPTQMVFTPYSLRSDQKLEIKSNQHIPDSSIQSKDSHSFHQPLPMMQINFGNSFSKKPQPILHQLQESSQLLSRPQTGNSSQHKLSNNQILLKRVHTSQQSLKHRRMKSEHNNSAVVDFLTHQLIPSQGQMTKERKQKSSYNEDGATFDNTKNLNHEVSFEDPRIVYQSHQKLEDVPGVHQVRLSSAPQSSNMKKRKPSYSSIFKRGFYEINKDGKVVVLTSKVQDSEGKLLKEGSPEIMYQNEQLSTDETEVRLHLEEIEKTVQERALSRYNQIMEEGKTKQEAFKVAKKINDITFRYRIQNGGALTGSVRSSAMSSNEVKVNQVSGLDVTPFMGENEKNVNFEGFECNFVHPQASKVRVDYPAIGSGQTYNKTQTQPSILHSAELFDQFARPPSRYNIVGQRRGIQTTSVMSKQNSPQKIRSNEEPEKVSKLFKRRRNNTAYQKETELMKRMSEARKKFFNEQDSSQPNASLSQADLGTLSNHNSPQTFKNLFQNKLKAKPLCQEEKLQIKQELEKDDKFVRSDIQSTRLRMVSQDKGSKLPIDLGKWGFDKTSGVGNSSFDPLRLKILAMPYQDANPVGKNADYFFLKGFKYSVSEEFAHAMSSYLKGLDIKSDHLLCRYNLGVMLFKLGLYEEAMAQYDILASQGYGERPVVQYNKALSEFQSGKYLKALESTQKCIQLIMKNKKKEQANIMMQKSSSKSNGGATPNKNNHESTLERKGKGLNNSEIEMLSDMHVVQGLCNLRTQNLKRAGKCFDEAKQFKPTKKCELITLVEKCVYKLVQTRMLEHFRKNARSQQFAFHADMITPFSEDGAMAGALDTFGVQNAIYRLNNKSQLLTHGADQLNQEQQALANNQSKLSRKSRNGVRASSMAKIYLTDIDINQFNDPSDVKFISGQGKVNTQDSVKPLKRSKSQKLLNIQFFLDDLYEYHPSMPQQIIQKEHSKGARSPLKNERPPTVDELTYPELLEMIKQLITQKSDPQHCYHYIDDDKTIRLDKILDLPNSFELKDRLQLTDKERMEKQKREAIEIYYQKSARADANSRLKNLKALNAESERTVNDRESIQSSEEDNEQKQQNYLIDNYFQLQDKLQAGLPDQKKEDQESFNEFLFQIKKFNQKLDLSLNYFLNEAAQQSNQFEKSKSIKKLDSEIEQNIKEIKDKIVEQANKKEDIELNRLKINEIKLLKEEFKQDERDLSIIEPLLLKLKAFKNLNPALRQFMIMRGNLIKFQKNDVIYQQGTEGQCYYYLIRGSVSMLSNRADFGNFDLYLKSYYDGDVFGEQPQLFAKSDTQVASDDQLFKLSLRDSTCIANEKCLILEVSNEVKQDFYRNDSNNQYERCLHWLRKNPIFKMTEGFYLLQMIFNIEKKVFKLGEVLVRSGDVPEGMFIITKGQCKAVLESIGIKAIESGEYSKFEKKPKNFVCGRAQTKILKQMTTSSSLTEPVSPAAKKQPQSPNRDLVASQISPSRPKVQEPKESMQQVSSNLNTRFNPDTSAFNSLKGNQQKCFQSTRLYLDDEGKHLPQHIAFTNNINYGILVPGDSFGSRVLIPDDELMKRVKPSDEDLARTTAIEHSQSLKKSVGTSSGTSCNHTNLQKGLQSSTSLHKGHGSHSNLPVFNHHTQHIMQLFKKLCSEVKASALSIVSESKEVEVLILKPNILTILPEQEKDKIYDDIAKLADPDKPSSLTEIMQVKSEDKKWAGFRARLVKDIRKSQYMERHKGQYQR